MLKEIYKKADKIATENPPIEMGLNAYRFYITLSQLERILKEFEV